MTTISKTSGLLSTPVNSTQESRSKTSLDARIQDVAKCPLENIKAYEELLRLEPNQKILNKCIEKCRKYIEEFQKMTGRSDFSEDDFAELVAQHLNNPKYREKLQMEFDSTAASSAKDRTSSSSGKDRTSGAAAPSPKDLTPEAIAAGDVTAQVEAIVMGVPHWKEVSSPKDVLLSLQPLFPHLKTPLMNLMPTPKSMQARVNGQAIDYKCIDEKDQKYQFTVQLDGKQQPSLVTFDTEDMFIPLLSHLFNEALPKMGEIFTGTVFPDNPHELTIFPNDGKTMFMLQYSESKEAQNLKIYVNVPVVGEKETEVNLKMAEIIMGTISPTAIEFNKNAIVISPCNASHISSKVVDKENQALVKQWKKSKDFAANIDTLKFESKGKKIKFSVLGEMRGSTQDSVPFSYDIESLPMGLGKLLSTADNWAFAFKGLAALKKENQW